MGASIAPINVYIYSIRNGFRLSFLNLLKTLRQKYAGSPAFGAVNQIIVSIDNSLLKVLKNLCSKP